MKRLSAEVKSMTIDVGETSELGNNLHEDHFQFHKKRRELASLTI
jgi:hypothetical protein